MRYPFPTISNTVSLLLLAVGALPAIAQQQVEYEDWPATQPALTGKSGEAILWDRTFADGTRITLRSRGWLLNQEWQRAVQHHYQTWSSKDLTLTERDGTQRLLWAYDGPGDHLAFYSPLAVHVEQDTVAVVLCEDWSIRLEMYPVGIRFIGKRDARSPYGPNIVCQVVPESAEGQWTRQVVRRFVPETDVARGFNDVPPQFNDVNVKARFSGSLAEGNLAVTIDHYLWREKYVCEKQQKSGERPYVWRQVPTTQPTEAEKAARRKARRPSWTEPD